MKKFATMLAMVTMSMMFLTRSGPLWKYLFILWAILTMLYHYPALKRGVIKLWGPR